MPQDDDRLRIRLAEIMSSAGVGYNQISLEILYMLPREFVDRYIELWESAYGPTVRAPGDGMARDGELGKATTETRFKGKMVGSGAGGTGKRLARSFGVRSEDAMRLKDRIDRRLRSIGRDVREELMVIADKQIVIGPTQFIQCSTCGKVMQEHWRFCPWDASNLKASVNPELNKDIE